MAKKMFGNTGGRNSSGRRRKKNSGLKTLVVFLSLLLLVELAYCVVIFTDWIPPISRLRTMYIETAMSTMRHQWLAKALIPGDVVQDVIDKINQAQMNQVGVNSGWDDVPEHTTEEPKSPSSGFSKDAAADLLNQITQNLAPTKAEKEFFQLFYELDEESTVAYTLTHPETIADGWANYWVNEAGLNDKGTTIRTTQGDQVLAIDAANGLLVIRVTGMGYRGVLVIGKDPSRLTCGVAKYLGELGQRAGDIAERYDGLVAMTASGFGDAENVAEGSDLAGGCMSQGKEFGEHYQEKGYKRVELRTDNRLYIRDAYTDYARSCTDATEWKPALIVDGRIVVSAADGFTSVNPRACLGQTRDESILMLVIEGRNIDSLGTDASECADILARYGAYQAMNMDGGTSAILWYQGEYITKCSNEDLPEGRHLPNAWIYAANTVPDP
jgi:exopolysaccharide biosynthesis protein